MEEIMTKEEYNKIPVYYCKYCHSLKIIRNSSHEDDVYFDYCDDCGSTIIGKASIEAWLDIKKNKKNNKF